MILRPVWAGAALVAPGCAPNAVRILPAGAAQPVFAEDFESGGGALGVDRLRDPRLAIVEPEGVGGGHALRVTYVGGPMGSERLVRVLPLGGSGTEFTLSYDVKFDRDFQFVRGGKMHGLGPRRPVSGGAAIRPDGWSARVMWRAHGRPETYIYHQDQQGRYGEAGETLRLMAFERERYYAVSLHVKLNAPAGLANGAVRLYVDGALIEAREGLRLRAVASPDSLIGAFLFSTFHGGKDPSWAPRSGSGGYGSVTAYFDNFTVSAGERVRERPGLP